MSKPYTVEPGDCIDSIAFQHGFAAATIWNHGSNSALKSRRKNPNTLVPGDIVHIPDLTLKNKSCAAETRHRFKRKSVPVKLNVQFEFNGKARSAVPYNVEVDGVVKSGKTDGDGWIRLPIAPNAREARIELRPKDAEPEHFFLQLGCLEPVDTIIGQKARLKNLGFFDGDLTPDATPDFKAALAAFQAAFKLSPTGSADDATQGKLRAEHRS
ncbi:MAG TPA: LysM domain-containing protein [Lacunisphaera sp.]|nr:LysM domain-containing protein [Lacunisphaera sp.]